MGEVELTEKELNGMDDKEAKGGKEDKGEKGGKDKETLDVIPDETVVTAESGTDIENKEDREE